MLELIIIGVKLLIKVFQWFWGKKEMREIRAQEIADLFIKVRKEGDSLAEQIHIEMSLKSDVDWEDIKVRDMSE